MGNLINPLSRVLGHSSNLFWTNNFSFFFNKPLYKRQIYKIQSLKKIFQYLFLLFSLWFKIGKIKYSLVINFAGQQNESVFLNLYLSNYSYRQISSIASARKSSRRKNKKKLSKPFILIRNISFNLKKMIQFILLRYIKMYQFWRRFILDFSFKSLGHEILLLKAIPSSFKENAIKFFKHSTIFQSINFENYRFLTYFNALFKNYRLIKRYLHIKFKIFFILYKTLKSSESKLTSKLLILFLSKIFPKFMGCSKIRNFHLKIHKKNNRKLSLAKSICKFCFRALDRGLKANYILRAIRKSLFFVKDIRGFRLIISGHFFRRGRALFVASTYRDRGPLTGQKFFKFVKMEKIRLYGLCAIKLLLFFRRKNKFFLKTPLNCSKYEFFKYTRAGLKPKKQINY